MKKLKKICFIVTSPFAVNSFLAVHLIELSKYFDITLCVNLKLYKLSPVLGNIKIINVPLQRKISPLRDFLSLCILIKIFAFNKFDCVHSITVKAGFLSAVAALLLCIPKRIHTFTGQFWVTQVGLGRILFKKVDFLIAYLSTHVFADSFSQLNFLIAENIVDPKKISILGEGSISGVDIVRFNIDLKDRLIMRSDLNANDSDCVFLFVGRLTRDKGIFDLLSAFHKLSDKSNNAKLWIVGPDEDGLVEGVKKYYLSLSDRIKWIGVTFRPEVYMSSADVLVLPSMREGFGTVIIEAAASGIPTIAYRINGVIDAVIDGSTGLLVSPGSVTELFQKMYLLNTDSNLRKALGMSAKSRAIKYFSSVDITKKWTDFYRLLLEKPDEKF